MLKQGSKLKLKTVARLHEFLCSILALVISVLIDFRKHFALQLFHCLENLTTMERKEQEGEISHGENTLNIHSPMVLHPPTLLAINVMIVIPFPLNTVSARSHRASATTIITMIMSITMSRYLLHKRGQDPLTATGFANIDSRRLCSCKHQWSQLHHVIHTIDLLLNPFLTRSAVAEAPCEPALIPEYPHCTLFLTI